MEPEQARFSIYSLAPFLTLRSAPAFPGNALLLDPHRLHAGVLDGGDSQLHSLHRQALPGNSIDEGVLALASLRLESSSLPPLLGWSDQQVRPLPGSCGHYGHHGIAMSYAEDVPEKQIVFRFVPMLAMSTRLILGRILGRIPGRALLVKDFTSTGGGVMAMGAIIFKYGTATVGYEEKE